MDGRGVDLQPIFAKLGHQLEEIRLRALNNILSKLEHNLICESDLVQEKHFLIRLIEWFNFPTTPQELDVLKLILRLAKHPGAANILLQIGSVAFLTKLRENRTGLLRTLIDDIIETLFRLPVIDSGEVHSEECVYRVKPLKPVIPTEYLEPSDSYYTPRDQDVPERSHVVPHEDRGYFHATTEERHLDDTSASNGSANCFMFSTFPWLGLTPTDRHVLDSTDSSLRSRETGLIVSACDFLCDVVFQDFPAEVFLQRPNIVKSLLSLLEVPADEHFEVNLAGVKTLQYLSQCLHTRLAYYQDPSLYTPKQDFTSAPSHSSSLSSSSSQSMKSSDTRPSAIGRSDIRCGGDGRDRDSSSSSNDTSRTISPDLEVPDIEDIQALQFMQMTLPQFCISTLQKSLPLLKHNSEKLQLYSALLIQKLLNILEESVTSSIWSDPSPAARELMDKLTECIDILGDVITFNNHSTSQAGLKNNRMRYLIAASLLVRLLKDLVPKSKALDVLPESSLSILNILLMDECLAMAYPDVRELLIGYLQETDVTQPLIGYLKHADCSPYQVFEATSEVCKSMSATCKLLMMEDICAQHRNDVKERLKLAENAIYSLPYHQYLPLVDTLINMASIIYNFDVEDSLHHQNLALVLKCMTHPMSSVRERAFAKCLQLTKKTFGLDNAVTVSCFNPIGLFITDRKVLDQLYSHSLFDAKVSKVAEEILLYIFQSQLVVPSTIWRQILDNVVAIFPIIQTVISMQGSLGNCLLKLCEAKPHDEGTSLTLPTVERLRGCLRMLYMPDIRLRTEGLNRLAWFLTSEENSTQKLPVFSQLNVTDLANLLIVDLPVHPQDLDTGRSVFEIDGMMKVYDIFRSPSVDHSVKKSALEQLAVILQDTHLHKAFRKEDGVQRLIHTLRGCVKKDSNELQQGRNMEFIPPCLVCLHALIRANPNLRHSLARDGQIYYDVIRSAILCARDTRTKQEVASILLFLLFDELVQEKFSLPGVIVDSYKLPIKFSSYATQSPHIVPMPIENDPLMTRVNLDRLRVFWNLSWHNGIDDLMQSVRQPQKHTEFSSKLTLTEANKAALMLTYSQIVIQQCAYDITNATSHDAVSKQVYLMTVFRAIESCLGMETLFTEGILTEAFDRFMTTLPASEQDEQLLIDILTFLSLHFAPGVQHEAPKSLRTFCERLTIPESAVLQILAQNNTDGETQTKRTLGKLLLQYIGTVSSRLPYPRLNRSTETRMTEAKGNLMSQLILKLNLTDTTHFYNLSSLESSLQCLLHLTARVGWSEGCRHTDRLSLCQQFLSCLLEIVSAFHIGRGGVLMSYMGKGVTRCAVLCLRHLIIEIASLSVNETWPEKWVFSKSGSKELEGEDGFNWLLTLWAYRDPEVRAAGLGIAVALTSTHVGRVTMATHCTHYLPGGIWGAAFSILLDQSECSIVRRQAALLLVNLISEETLNKTTATSKNSELIGPVINTPDSQVLTGKRALIALLEHSNFYPEIHNMLSNYYPQPLIHPVSIAAQSPCRTPLGSQSTLTTSGTPDPQSVGDTTVTFLDTTLPSLNNPSTSTPAPVDSFPSQHTRPGDGTTSHSIHQRAALRHIQTPPTVTTATSTPASIHGHIMNDGGRSSTGTMASGHDYPSVVTPGLIDAVAQVLQNLSIRVSEDTITSLLKDNLLVQFTELLQVKLLEAYSEEITNGTRPIASYKIVFSNLLTTYSSLVGLLDMCLLKSSVVLDSVQDNKSLLRNVVQMLKITQNGFEEQCNHLRGTVYQFLSTLLSKTKGNKLMVVMGIFLQDWTIISESLHNSIKSSCDDLKVQACRFLTLLLSRNNERGDSEDSSCNITDGLNTQLYKEDGDVDSKTNIFTSTIGANLCQCLMEQYDRISVNVKGFNPVWRAHVIVAFKSLLAVHEGSKITALEGGLMETIIENIKCGHNDLNSEALQMGGLKKDTPTLENLILTLELLRNFMHRYVDAKVVAFECGLSNILHKLWSWCLLDNGLLTTTLGLLCTYTAGCSQASSSLVSTSVHAIIDQPQTKGQVSNSSLLNCLLKLANKPITKENLAMMKLLHSLLATLSLTAECRGVFNKSNFLQGFSSLNPKSKKSKLQHSTDTWWIDIALNLSFSIDGQQMIVKTKDAIELLLGFGSNPASPHHSKVLLALRNLCCHPSSKTKLLSNKHFLPFLIKCLSEGGCEEKVIAASALYALVYNSQKAKVAVKSANIQGRVQDVLDSLVACSSGQLIQAKDLLLNVVEALQE
ncbi:unnamed protein product [Owenia fusiformis]|uniref:Uncharacterized protein n=1 Tax=Owenia fusiformis TaxID=6347 RepID=A0A8J1TWX7_OWEFU|nr:unnamed protein product [Owenia fusiformis]